MTRDIKVEEAWTLQSSPEADRALNRLLKRERIEKPPTSLENGEEYRAWCLSRIELIAQTDENEQERESTRRRRARVDSASEEDLWAEYSQELPRFHFRFTHTPMSTARQPQPPESQGLDSQRGDPR